MFAWSLRRSLRFLAVAIPFVLVACSGTAPAPAAPIGGTLDIHAVDLAYRPSDLDVQQPGKYIIKLTNDGKIQHNVTFSDGTNLAANPGETKTVEVDIPAGGLSFMCSVPGHSQAGMKGVIAIGGQAPAAAAVDHSAHLLATTLQPDPNAPAPPFVDATAPAVMSGTVHDLEIAVQEKDMTVVPGVVQHVWTFNGSVPAPTLRVRVGDTIRAHFKNLATNSASHSLDFHASQIAWNGGMRTINPGQELTVEWHADYAGVWMYHCVTGPPVLHVASGMYGMVIVEPKEGLPPVDKEFVLVQNEWYFGPQKGPISMDKASAGAPSPDYMAFNGIPNQYVDHPLQMNKGERGRIFVLNVGPNLESSFHIVGMIFDTVIKEGVALLPNNQGHYGSQAVDLAPAQGAIVEFVAPEDGLYEFVTHTFNFHDRGAHGVIQVGDGKPKS
jgi:nitrite reductase (NO-forming)